ncbi:Nucleoside-diphosphate-sugar epimerase [Hahella chejuensis KCTC 2396]|uniref:Nucleoside-diphosphate-sugar epimerase n=1 Tax=Hahella chejuensis (strain KCTC 2396) TaxID=349521 RepID=Q2SJG1_HAHCH|nr:NAD-dependent epimerase/dehydratase family protein [Hahella chejuensis]ABC29213.1 Nucleoside-diphosphate-sugar epimerase [Hahella chejuensis KCTC 2396]
MNVLITGCTGFVGSALAAEAASRGYVVTGTSRSADQHPQFPGKMELAPAYENDGWIGLLRGVDVLIHCAARVHQVKEDAAEPLAEFRAANTEATRLLASWAVKAGVKKFIYLSTIKVNGEGSSPGRPFTPSDPPNPLSPYAISKWEGECALREVAAGAEMSYEIIRPPLVYGEGAKGNLAILEKLAKLRAPLPLAGVENRRSLISRENLVDVILRCAEALNVEPGAGNVWLVSDGYSVTTSQIYLSLCCSMNIKGRVFSLPGPLKSLMFHALERIGIQEKLFGNLEVDCSATMSGLNWRPAPGIR